MQILHRNTRIVLQVFINISIIYIQLMKIDSLVAILEKIKKNHNNNNNHKMKNLKIDYLVIIKINRKEEFTIIIIIIWKLKKINLYIHQNKINSSNSAKLQAQLSCMIMIIIKIVRIIIA